MKKANWFNERIEALRNGASELEEKEDLEGLRIFLLGLADELEDMKPIGYNDKFRTPYGGIKK